MIDATGITLQYQHRYNLLLQDIEVCQARWHRRPVLCTSNPGDANDNATRPEEIKAEAEPLPNIRETDDEAPVAGPADDAAVAPTTAGEHLRRTFRAYIAADVDWDREKRQAVARSREQRALEERQLTFSFDDLLEEVPPDEPAPSKSVFDSQSVGRAGISFQESNGIICSRRARRDTR